MLIRTVDIVSMTQLREQLHQIILATQTGRTFAISDRGKIVSLIVPAKSNAKGEKVDLDKHSVFGLLKGTSKSNKEFLSGLSDAWW